MGEMCINFFEEKLDEEQEENRGGMEGKIKNKAVKEDGEK